MREVQSEARSLTIQSLRRGLRLLEFIAEQQDGCSVKYVSQVSGVKLSTCYHLLATLADAGYIERDQRSQNYVATDKLSRMHYLIQRHRAIPTSTMLIARTVAEVTRETAYIAVWENDDVVIRYIAEGDQAVRVRSLSIGYRDHPFVRALGKAVLANVPESTLAHFKSSHMPEQRTPYSKIQWADIEKELFTTFQRGFSIDEQEFEMDVCCIGVPIFHADGVVWGALSISMPSTRYRQDNTDTIAYLQKQGQLASLALGTGDLTSKEDHG